MAIAEVISGYMSTGVSIFTDHALSTRESNVFTLVCPPVKLWGSYGNIQQEGVPLLLAGRIRGNRGNREGGSDRSKPSKC